jgi:hypothetical protein
MNIIKFITRNSSHSTLHIGYKEKYIEETMNTKLLDLQTDNHINWKNHKEKMIPKLSEVYYAIRSMVRISNINTLKSVYYVYFNSIIKYGKIFLGEGVLFQQWENFSLYKRKLSELRLVHNPEPSVVQNLL